MAQDDIVSKITEAARAKGVDPQIALRIAGAESTNNPSAQNPRSTAGGLFQVIDDTWSRYGGKPGMKKDVQENIRVGTDIIADNTNILRKHFGREPQGHEVYAAHFFGPDTAKQVLAANPDQPMEALVSKKILDANPHLKGQSAGDVLNSLRGKMGAPSKKVADVDLNNVGPGYKAAMAMMFLADDKPKTEEDDIWKEAEPEVVAEEETPNPLADVELSYKSPFPVKTAAAQPSAAQQLAQFAKGGVVHRADGSPETGELTPEEIAAASQPAFMTPKSGIGRKAGPISEALNTGTAYPAMARGVAELPYDVVGGPVDIATLTMRPFGYKEEKPMMGSEWIKEKMTKLGIRPGEEANPTLQGFRTLGELGASAVNPGPVAAKVGQTAEKGAAFVGKEAARQVLRGMEGEGMLAPVSPPIMYAREPGKAAATGIFSHIPSNEAPFVGRLDEYISNLPGPVQKQQFFGQLKGKFRDYEIGRAEEALKDLPDNAKLTPSDLLNRVKGIYDPGRYKTTVLPPDPEASSINNRWRSMDNPFYNKETDEGVHLGVIHLNKDLPPELAQRQMAANDAVRTVKHMSNDWSIARYPERMDELENFLKTSGVQLQPELSKKLDTGMSQYRKIANYEEEMKAAKDRLMYPNLDPQYDALHEKYAAQLRQADPEMPNYVARVKTEPMVVRELAENANAWLAKNGYKPVKLPDYASITNPSMHAMMDSDMGLSIQEAFHPVKEQIGMADRNLAKHMKNAESEFKAAIGHELPYMGQHESLGGGPAQISFSRYSEHTADIPGMGPTQGIYVHELQSDMFDDLRKLGPKGGSAQKDKEEYDSIVEKLKSLDKARGEAYASGNNKMVDELDNQLVSAGGRADVLSKRLNGYKTDYSMDEAFHKMESGGKTTQQLMAKNAIAGAIQQGKNFVAFPGVESAQAKLYEKLPRNLKDVVKDLGPGFEIRPVELTGPAGKSMHTAVVWGPEAAARLQKKGVPFATGGLVDKAISDNRRYL